MAQTGEWRDTPPDLRSPEVSIETMDAAIGYMNRRLQTLIDGIAEQLYALGAFSKGSLGKVCSEYAGGTDFYNTILGIQIRTYLAGTSADSGNGPNLGQIVRNRNHFLHRYPKLIRNSGGKVPANEIQLLRDTISAIIRREDTFSEALQQMMKVQEKAKTSDAGRTRGSKTSADLEKVRRCIDDLVPRDRTMIPVNQLNNRLRQVLPGLDSQKVLGMKLKDYLAGCREYHLKDTNGGLKVGRS
ncbi:MAG: hypothetical protein MJZ38_04405 [archaeon]|nr:hypothetical protein [archaeon]